MRINNHVDLLTDICTLLVTFQCLVSVLGRKFGNSFKRLYQPLSIVYFDLLYKILIFLYSNFQISEYYFRTNVSTKHITKNQPFVSFPSTKVGKAEDINTQ